MTWGLKFGNAASNARIIDDTYLIPQLLLKLDGASASSVIDYPEGPETGWTTRRYTITAGSVATRPRMVFWTLPSNGQDVYLTGWSYRDGFGGGTNSYEVRVIFKSGTTFSAPQGYVFGVDYVSPSPDNWGMRIFAPDGVSVVFDSGNWHLNIQQIVTGVSVDMGFNTSTLISNEVVNSFSLSTLPSKPAFLLPYTVFNFDKYINNVGYGSGELVGCFRYSGQTLYSMMLRTKYPFIEDPSTAINSLVTYSTYGMSSGLSIPVIDASLYD